MLNHELDQGTLEVEYQQYLLKCEEDGIIKPKTIHQFKWAGIILFPKKQQIIEPKLPTKADLARIIFQEEVVNGLVRKIVIKRFMNEAGLTIGGAGTYYSNMLNKQKQVLTND